MTVNELRRHLDAIVAAGPDRGAYEVRMVDKNDNALPVECPVCIGDELCLYSEKLF